MGRSRLWTTGSSPTPLLPRVDEDEIEDGDVMIFNLIKILILLQIFMK